VRRPVKVGDKGLDVPSFNLSLALRIISMLAPVSIEPLLSSYSKDLLRLADGIIVFSSEFFVV